MADVFKKIKDTSTPLNDKQCADLFKTKVLSMWAFLTAGSRPADGFLDSSPYSTNGSSKPSQSQRLGLQVD